MLGLYGPSSAEVGETPTAYDSPAILKSDERVFKTLMKMSKMVQELHSIILLKEHKVVDRSCLLILFGGSLCSVSFDPKEWICRCLHLHQHCSSFRLDLDTVSMLGRRKRETSRES